MNHMVSSFPLHIVGRQAQQLHVNGQAIKGVSVLVRQIADCRDLKVLRARFRLSSHGPLRLRHRSRSLSPDMRRSRYRYHRYGWRPHRRWRRDSRSWSRSRSRSWSRARSRSWSRSRSRSWSRSRVKVTISLKVKSLETCKGPGLVEVAQERQPLAIQHSQTDSSGAQVKIKVKIKVKVNMQVSVHIKVKVKIQVEVEVEVTYVLQCGRRRG